MKLKLYKKVIFLLFGCFLCLHVLAQEPVQITGTVSSNKGELLPGVSVKLKGTSQGTVTNLRGEFSIRVPAAQSSLLISYIGYAPKEVNVGNSRTLKIILEESSRQLNDVVVTALGIR
ncbi:MAG: TonB-dependent receptor, partial [Sphingobacteriaceae bacterium]